MKTNSTFKKLILTLHLTLLVLISWAQSPSGDWIASETGNYAYKGDYRIIFQDEFDGNTLDTKKWITWFPDACGDETSTPNGNQDEWARLQNKDNGL